MESTIIRIIIRFAFAFFRSAYVTRRVAASGRKFGIIASKKL